MSAVNKPQSHSHSKLMETRDDPTMRSPHSPSCELASTPLNVEMQTILSSASPSKVRVTDGYSKARRLVLSPDVRRRRRLDREQERVRKVRARVAQLQRDMKALKVTRDERIRQIQRHSTISLWMQQYLSLVGSVDELRRLQQRQRDQLLQHQMRSAMLDTMVHCSCRFRIALNQQSDDQTAFEKRILMDPIGLYESTLKREPLATHEAEAFVADSCREMFASVEQPDWLDGFQAFGGLTGGCRVEGSLLEFRLNKRLSSATAATLAEKTWTLLTRYDQYRSLQPQTTQLRVLQRLSDTMWVIGIAVGRRHSLVLVGRVSVAGRYIVTFRSLPLIRHASEASMAAYQRFVEDETGGIQANTFSWYSFEDHRDANCNVVFGGTAHNIHPDYLNQLQLEIVAGFARWQTAMAFPHVLFTPSLVT